MCLWTKQALYCQSDNSKKFVLLLIEKGEMNLVLPVVRHFVRLHGNHKMLLVSKKVLVLPISFEYHWIGIVGNPAQTKRRCNDEKNDTNWQSCEMECKIVGSKVTSIVWSCSLGNVTLISLCLQVAFGYGDIESGIGKGKWMNGYDTILPFVRVRYPFPYPYPSVIQTPVLRSLAAAINVFLLGKCLMCPFVSCLCSTFSENLLFLVFQSDIRESTSNSRYINPVDI